MRKIIPILLICLLLTACGRTAPASTSEPTDAPTSEPVTEETGGVDMSFTDGGTETLSFAEAAAKVRSDADAAYLFAANVGKGDALVLRVGDWTGLVDTGKAWARGRVVGALALMGSDAAVDAVFLTHTDDDHAGGLEWLASEASVGALYAPAM